MIARKSALIVFTNIVNAIFGYVTLFFISRYMSPWEYGIVGFAFGFVSLFNIFGTLGFNSAHIKRISEGKDLGKCIGTFLTIKVGLIVLMISVVLGAMFFWKVVIGGGFESDIHEKAIYIMLIYSVLSLATNSMLSTFRAKKEIAKAQFPILFETLTRTIATIFVALGGYGALYLVSTYIIGWSANFISSIFFFKRFSLN